ncbi:MAG: acyl-CoA dehydrogenase family protein [Myxococcota bacterium]
MFARCRIALAAEGLGIAQGAAEVTKEYASTRTQFGRPLAGFQVLLHRMTDMFVDVETTRSLVYRAAEATAAELPGLAAQAKLKASSAGLAVTKDAIQIHGGIGVTEELVVGHWYRRMLTVSMLLGDVAELRLPSAA